MTYAKPPLSFWRTLPSRCPYCERPLAVRQEWRLGRVERTLECPRYSVWWMLVFGAWGRHFMTVLDPWEWADR